MNLYSIQIKQRTYFMQLGKQQYNVSTKSYPPRALIYDRNGHPLALNKKSLSAFIMPRKIQKIEQLEPFLKQQFPHALERLYAHPDAHFLYIKRAITPQQKELIEQNNIQDIKFLQEPNRTYPVQSLGSVVGITDVDNKGLFGIERIFDEQLTGIAASHTLEKDARSGHFYFEKKTTQAGIDGTPVTLTIDADLQFLVHEELRDIIKKFNAKEGMVLILDPTTGEILTSAQEPLFDPEDTTALDLALTKQKAITDVHEFGSVMKVFVALAALEEGVVEVDELIDCENTKSTLLHGRPINTVKPHGIIPFSEVIQYSNNIGIAKVAQRLGPKLYDHYTRLGFGKKTGIGWPGEQKGFINHPDNWSKQSLISLSFGYELNSSLLQLARAFSLFANRGRLITPTFIKHKTAPLFNDQLYSDESINYLRDMLEKTVQRGTARRAALQGYQVMGKTGTGNLLVDGIYNPDANIYTFVGIIERDIYKRVIAVSIKESDQKDLYAATVAAPLFERVAQQMVIHDNIIS